MLKDFISDSFCMLPETLILPCCQRKLIHSTTQSHSPLHVHCHSRNWDLQISYIWFFFKVGKIFQNMLNMWTAVSHICESRQSLRHNIQSCFDLKWDTAMYEWRDLHLSRDPPITQVTATICSQVTHIRWLLGQRQSTCFCQLTSPLQLKRKTNTKKRQWSNSVSWNWKRCKKKMQRKHLWSCFYQMTRTQSDINVNSRPWGRGPQTSNCFRDRKMLARVFLNVALVETQGLCSEISYTRIKGL